jgi:exopolysaccharide biosynthesis polyprenyl glycosylphosphotransferase
MGINKYKPHFFEMTTKMENSTSILSGLRSLKSSQWTLFTFGLMLMDSLMIAVAFRLAYIIRFNLGFSFFNLNISPIESYYGTLTLVTLPLFLTIFALQGLYNRNNLLGGTKEYSGLLNGTSIGMFVIVTIEFLITDFVFARGWLIIAWGGTFIFTGFGRFIIRRIIYFLRYFGLFLRHAVIVGANDEGILLAQQLMQWKTSGFQVLGFIDKKLPVGTKVIQHLTCIGSVKQLDETILEHNVEEVILATSAFSSRDNMLEIFRRHGTENQVNVRFSSGIYEIITTGLSVKEFAYVPLVAVNPLRLTGADLVIKTILDYGLTIPGLILLSPLLLILAILIRIESPGPVIHKRRVIGVNKKPFYAYKFRTMYVNGDEILSQYSELQKELAENYKLKDDPRVTRLGKVIRKLSLDELPQMFNILRGEMSLVGPRMITPDELVKYHQWDMNLMTVRPGITGLWQVSGRSDVTYEERVRLDMYYIRNWSIWFDLQILFQTIPAVLNRRGAY